MNKTILISSIVFISLVSVVVAIYSSDVEESVEGSEKQLTKKQPEQKQAAETAKNKTAINKKEVKANQKAKTSKTKLSQNKTTTKPKANKAVSNETSNTRVVRVRWPGMKHRMVRVVKEEKIEPASELRTWSRKQWVEKVTDLRKANEDKLAEQYITAYNQQYPAKDLNNYLK